MKKRILSVLLSLVMVVGLLPTAALAAESTPGSSADNPVVCTTYAQFKAAMEDWDVSYVKIKDIGKNSGGEVLPSHTGLAIGASVYNRAPVKYLIIEGESTLIAPLKHSAYQCLIYVGNGAKLHVSGSGSLTFKANTDYSTNALIENHGECTVESGTLRGTYNSDVYGRAIISTANSTLTINGGSFYGGVASSKLEYPFGAVWVGDKSKVTIKGGTFESEVYSGITIDEYATNNALIVNESADCKITGGATFVNGIRLIKKSYTPTKYLSELLADGFCMVAQDRTTDSYQVYSPDSNATNVDDLIWVVTKPTLTSVKVNGVDVAGYNVSTGYGETTVKANEETTVTATFNIPSWVNANKVDVKNVICGVVSNTSESTSGALTWNGDKTTATTTVTFTPEAGKTYTFMNAIAVGTSPNYFAILPANLKMDVEVPPEPLTGTVTYTGAARYGAPLTANVSGLPTGVDEDDLTYQWLKQTTVNGKKAWISIRGATSETYTPDEDMVGKTIRVKVSAEGYLGSIYGAEKKVEKAFNYGTPTAPQLSCTGTTITVGDWKDAQEYCYTTTAPGSKVTWPEGGAGTEIGKEDKSFTGTAGTTYYVYTRIAATDTTLAGTTVRVSSIKVPTTDSSGGEDDVYATGLIYPDYPTTPRTIYVEKGKTVEVKYQITPANANKNLPTWKERSIGDGYPYLTVSQTAQNTASGIGTITIKGDKTTSTDGVPVTPYKNDSEQWASGNTYDLTVVVYDPTEPATVPLTSTDLGSVDLYVGDTYDLKLDTLKSTLNFLPAGGSKDGYTLKAYVLKKNTTGAPSYESADSYISINSDTGVITANAATTTGSMVYVVALAEGETKSPSRYIATLTVKVEAKPTVALESIAINPETLTLRVNDTFNLALTKTPEDATDAITWSVSPTTGVVSVDSNGKVTADATGTATITATSNTDSSITATCTVTVKKAHTSDHTLSYTDKGTYHTWTCTDTDCGATGVEAHTYGTWSKKDDTDTHKHTCTKCNHEETANHSWVLDSTTPATFDAPGNAKYKCATCSGEKDVALAQLTAIADAEVFVTTPVRGAASAGASAAIGGGFYVTETTWDPADTTFAASTVYIVTIKLAADSGKGFNASTSFTINGNAPTSKTITSNTTATLTYTFPATAGSGSSGGGGGSYTPSYAITVESTKNGDVTVSPKSASKGATVTVTVAPDKGYDLETLTVLDKDGKEIKLTDKGNGKYTFTMPASKVTVKGTFMEDNTMLNFFVDVPADAYYYDAVLWAAKEGITGGVDAVHFAPNAACTRAQIVTFLWRAAGCPEPKAASSFSDVSADAYYAKAVAWAVENGITGGIGGNKFAPDLTCTRAQAVTFLYRAAGSPAVSGGTTFSDVSAEAYYANAVAWAAANGITGGIGGGLFGSNNDCTRAQIVTFLYRSVK